MHIFTTRFWLLTIPLPANDRRCPNVASKGFFFFFQIALEMVWKPILIIDHLMKEKWVLCFSSLLSGFLVYGPWCSWLRWHRLFLEQLDILVNWYFRIGEKIYVKQSRDLISPPTLTLSLPISPSSPIIELLYSSASLFFI